MSAIKEFQGIKYTEDEFAQLEAISKSPSYRHDAVIRAKVLVNYFAGQSKSVIAVKLDISRPLIYRCIHKAKAFGVIEALNDLAGKGTKSKISDEAVAWVINLACQFPKDLGYANETWSYSLLKKHVRENCKAAGFGELVRADKGMLHKWLNKAGIRPHKIQYYLERRDDEFDQKMVTVLAVYRDVMIINKENPDGRKKTTVSYDEKPGIQAIMNIAAQLLPIPGQHPTIGRDYEYKRLGTVTLMAAIDLHTGIIIPLVKDRHRSAEFIEFLKQLDSKYQKDWIIRIILDNHSAHKSKETMKYLLTTPGRFEMVFTPTHGSWLNMIEIFFSKIARGFLRDIRVKSKKELVERIYLGLEEINKEPIVFKWKYKMEDLDKV